MSKGQNSLAMRVYKEENVKFEIVPENCTIVITDMQVEQAVGLLFI